MFLKTSFTTVIVGVFVVYVLHTCWVMYGIVYTKPCDSPKGDNCITPFLAGDPKLQVSNVEGWMVALLIFVFACVASSILYKCKNICNIFVCVCVPS